MSEYSFRLKLDAPQELTDADLNRLYEATRSQASFSSDNDGWSAEFDREASSFAMAVVTAIADIDLAGLNVHARELESDDAALVNGSEIARRTGLSREAIRLYAEGERNRDLGPFPPALTTFKSGQRIWRWGDVAPWLSRATGRDLGSAEQREVTGLINDVLDIRRRMPRLPKAEQAVVAQALDREMAGIAS